MKTRIISAVAAIAVLAAIIYLGRAAVGIAVFMLSLVAVYEFFGAMKKGGFRPVTILGYLSCLPLLYYAYTGFSGGGQATVFSVIIFVFMVVLFCLAVFKNKDYNLTDISVTLFGIMYIAFLFSFVTLARNLEGGYLYIWMILIGASATDTFAYFTGVSIGKTKILPAVSPKKTLEGSIGGVVGCIATMTAFGAYAGSVLGIPLYHFMILGGLCGIISQLGDWAASAIKRFVGIKDYGHILPGHGGVLDRIDSVLFTAPVVYFYISLIIMV
jgi:phosphatidate cytidylyltransferase